jgi:P22 coat protein - gene protein 5
MATNNFVTPSWVVKETSRIAQNSLKFAANVTRKYASDFKAGGAKIGSGFSLRLPQRYATTKGAAFQAQGLQDITVRFNITDQANIGIAIAVFDEQFSVEEKRTRYIKPASIQLANTIDFDGLTRCTPAVAHSVGTPGTTPTTYQTYLDAVTKLRNVGVPDDDLVAMLSPNQTATLVGSNATVFNPSSSVSKNFRKGQFSSGENGLGVDSWYYDQNVWQRTTGSWTSTATPLVNQPTAVVDGVASINTDAWASGSTKVNIGDVWTFAGVNEINPENYTSTGQLMQVTITGNFTDSSGAIAGVTFSPPLISVGTGPIPNALANVDFLPADEAAIIPVGSSITTGSGTMVATATRQGLVYNPEAFVMAMVDPGGPDMFPGAEASSVSDAQTGWAATYVRQFSAQTYVGISRLDVFYGWLAYRPDWACRVQGGAS